MNNIRRNERKLLSCEGDLGIHTRVETDHEAYLRLLGLIEHNQLLDLKYWEQYETRFYNKGI